MRRCSSSRPSRPSSTASKAAARSSTSGCSAAAATLGGAERPPTDQRREHVLEVLGVEPRPILLADAIHRPIEPADGIVASLVVRVVRGEAEELRRGGGHQPPDGLTGEGGESNLAADVV